MPQEVIGAFLAKQKSASGNFSLRECVCLASMINAFLFHEPSTNCPAFALSFQDNSNTFDIPLSVSIPKFIAIEGKVKKRRIRRLIKIDETREIFCNFLK